ncbi:MAG: helix-turn-helix domain-containing protein [Lachnospiraceae bacterium]
MKIRTTDQLLNMIAAETNLQTFIAQNQDEFDYTSLAEALNSVLGKSGYSKAEVVRQSNLDTIYCYQIFDGKKTNPSRNKLLALCLSLKASLAETQYILRLGHCESLHPRNVRDSVIIFAINHSSSVFTVNDILHSMKEEILK